MFAFILRILQAADELAQNSWRMQIELKFGICNLERRLPGLTGTTKMQTQNYKQIQCKKMNKKTEGKKLKNIRTKKKKQSEKRPVGEKCATQKQDKHRKCAKKLK